MSLDPSFIGRTYPAAPVYEVGREKIREFADAIGDPNPVYRDTSAARMAGHLDVIAPPTFPIVITARIGEQVISDPQLGLDYTKVVHGMQRFVVTRPIRVGDRLTGVLTVDNIQAAAGNDLISTRVELTTEDGEHIVTAYSTLVARGTSAQSSQ
ncbi:MAG: MaoC family dehydratase N-terminal domain-containing protein [Geodermatophilaceae bacterium]|nr:MaoC family dehydratase N-terminal domain-containing protein [Geodermatophilaceae bacterium]